MTKGTSTLLPLLLPDGSLLLPLSSLSSLSSLSDPFPAQAGGYWARAGYDMTTEVIRYGSAFARI